MSLKAFHVVFITAASLLCLAFGILMLVEFRSPQGTAGELWMGVGSLTSFVALVVYERFFLKKLKNVSYL